MIIPIEAECAWISTSGMLTLSPDFISAAYEVIE
jgi:hypothetical protein